MAAGAAVPKGYLLPIKNIKKFPCIDTKKLSMIVLNYILRGKGKNA